MSFLSSIYHCFMLSRKNLKSFLLVWKKKCPNAYSCCLQAPAAQRHNRASRSYMTDWSAFAQAALYLFPPSSNVFEIHVFRLHMWVRSCGFVFMRLAYLPNPDDFQSIHSLTHDRMSFFVWPFSIHDIAATHFLSLLIHHLLSHCFYFFAFWKYYFS